MANVPPVVDGEDSEIKTRAETKKSEVTHQSIRREYRAHNNLPACLGREGGEEKEMWGRERRAEVDID